MAPPRPQLQDLLDRYVALWEQADIPSFVALLREDAWLAMPPLPVWFQGRAAIATWLSTRIFTPDRQRRLLPTRANGSPAFGLYLREADAEVYQLFGLVVLGLAATCHDIVAKLSWVVVVWLVVVGVGGYFWTWDYIAHGPDWHSEGEGLAQDPNHALNIWPRGRAIF